MILVGDKLLQSYVLAKVPGGLSANAVNKVNVTAHIIGNKSNSTSGGLSANSTSGGLSANSINIELASLFLYKA
jgi:hypothetical protein